MNINQLTSFEQKLDFCLKKLKINPKDIVFIKFIMKLFVAKGILGKELHEEAGEALRQTPGAIKKRITRIIKNADEETLTGILGGKTKPTNNNFISKLHEVLISEVEYEEH